MKTLNQELLEATLEQKPEGLSNRAERKHRALGRLAAFGLAAGAVHMGGVAATHISPHRTNTQGVEVSSRLSIDPTMRSQIFLGTGVGTVSQRSKYRFVPGVELSAEVTEEALDRFPSQINTIKNKAARDEIVSEVITDQSKHLAGRYMLGAFAVAGLIGFSASRLRGDAGRNVLKRTTNASVIGLMAGAASMAYIAHAYSGDNTDSIRSSGVLADAINTPGYIEKIDAGQTEQLSKYVAGWRELGNLASLTWGSTTEDSQTAIRLLLVSDRHGRAQSELLKNVVNSYDIDAVVDSGDIVNFGTPEELSLSKIPESIEALGDTPYIFVTGNHDGTAINDTSVARELSLRSPNVILLQPKINTYQEVSVGGYKIAGVNDWPRYNGDTDPTEVAGLFAPYADRFNAAFDPASLDMVVAHEPGMLQQLKTDGIKVHGHTHKSVYSDSQPISVGTLSGGDPIRSSDNTQGSFAVLEIGTDCNEDKLTIVNYSVDGNSTRTDGMSTYFMRDKSDDKSGRVCGVDQGIQIRNIVRE